jgi:hypothetical protein
MLSRVAAPVALPISMEFLARKVRWVARAGSAVLAS